MKKSKVGLFLSTAAIVLGVVGMVGCGRGQGGNTTKGDIPHLGQGTWCAKSGDELFAMMGADHSASDTEAANYIYDEHVISYLIDCDVDSFVDVTENNDFANAQKVKKDHGATEVKTLKKAYKIGLIRNDGTSDESVAFENYIKYIGTKFNVTFTFVTTTSGDATADKNQIETWGNSGYDAVICLSNSANYDGLQLADQYGMKYCMFAGHPNTEDEADMVKDFPNSYTGSIGPTNETEGKSGYNLAKYFVDQGKTKYAIFGGAVPFGAEMHVYRVAGMLQAMIDADTTGKTNYKGKKGLEEIASTILTERKVGLTDLKSETYTLTGYHDGFSTDDPAWITGLKNAADSGEEVMLCAGASDLVMGMTGLHTKEGTPIKVGGIDSLTPAFGYFFSTGCYQYCDGKFSSMPGPMLAALIRDLEGNKVTIASK